MEIVIAVVAVVLAVSCLLMVTYSDMRDYFKRQTVAKTNRTNAHTDSR